ncbi:MAG: hypothetical protein Kow0079_00080 [Vicingaceae bacterium]
MYFYNEQFFYLIVSFIFTISSICVHFFFQKEKLSLKLLLLSAVFIGLFSITLDPFLNEWDEQFHALVAKNLINNPVKPILLNDSLVDIPFRNWENNTIWLHKQPFFLWLMALSIKIFGINSFAVRFPSLCFFVIDVLVIYKLAKALEFKNNHVAFLAALIFSHAYFFIELMNGFYATDHNDFIFFSLVTLSIYYFILNTKAKSFKNIFFIGLFTGFALLTKWLPGFLVFLIWMLYALFNKRLKIEFKNMAFSLIISLLVFLPWQIYTYINFTDEFINSYLHASNHFFIPLDGHDGDWLFHVNHLKTIYLNNDLIFYLVVFSLLILPKSIYKWPIIGTVIFVYLFFSISQTKMIGFTTIVSPFIFISLANFFSRLVKMINFKTTILYVLVCITISVFFMDLNHIENNHTFKKPNENYNRKGKLIEYYFTKQLQENINHKKIILLNMPHFSHIQTRFLTNIIAYNFIPDASVLIKLKKLGYRLIIIKQKEDLKIKDCIVVNWPSEVI